MQLVLDTHGLQLTKKGGVFEVIGEKSKREISPAKLSSIAVTATVILHSDAVVLAIKNQIPILFFDRIGKVRARLWSPYFESLATLRRQQVRFAESVEGGNWMVDVFMLKAEGQVQSLRFLASKVAGQKPVLDSVIGLIKQQSRQFEKYREQMPEEMRNQMMGTEGAIARVYWQGLGAALPRQYAFNKRTRQPAEDVFNAALNYLYGMLYSVVEGGIFAAGLDPYLGILHVDEYRKPTLSYDLIEPFRPWIDQLLVLECLEKRLQTTFFTRNQHGLFLNKEGKAFIIPLFNNFLRSTRTYFDRESTVKNHIYFLAHLLAQRIRGTV
ncbi:CRISPR-associated endonuclease Cas1 [Haliscomenobacter hydrossis]|uniref:CRISPR-associated endonuclease Cas1 n=1 Tax=Haliscomenobacter hydrossis (strain ATCC 27775 / DSM 1100 / LMG 10767 / O) TaxID=760192 RepID=F4L2L3_HALH1|nr:CRISPR-associated endonuclease Cas1 [Haliscomenobacter hydrossis]AEE53931.1 CRISPR-associated protein Cas1 [Haliscomenobacter hydrossis DSM 1100]